MASSPQNSPPAPSEESSSSSPPSTKSSTSAPTPDDSSASPSPPAPPQSPPPSKESRPPQTKENSPPPPSQGSSSSAPAPPGSSSNQLPPQSSPPLSQGANDGRNNEKDKKKKNKESSDNDKKKESSHNKHNKNNNSGNSNDGNTFSLPPSQKDNDSGNGNHSPPRSLGPPEGSSKSSGDSDSKDVAQIIGVVAGAGLLLLFVILLCVCCKRKKKRKSKLDHMQYYNASPFGDGTGGGSHYNNVPPQHRQNDNVMNLPAHAGGNRGAMPSPQPLVSSIHGSNNDSSNFSGQYGPSPPPHSPMALGFNQSTFTYDELAMATQGFSQANILGQGGFGYVYKGVLPNGKEVAVKSLKTGSGQGEREFQAEVDIISRVHHRHLVSLVGYCIAGEQRMLVYEFLPNNTLEFHLYGKGRPVMDWPTRMKIALGSAKGLAYLHEDCQFRIIHRDIKAANILLDFSFEAKVADFGLAKLSQDNFTHVSTRVMGTFGYLAPEYASSGKLTEKSDVFSFGVMLLELITGRPPVDLTGEMEDSLVDWARPLCLKAAQDGDYSPLADPRLEGNYEQHEMARMAASAAAAIRHSARRRPKMSQIVRALEGDVSLDDLNEGVRPGQSTYFGSATGSSDHNASTYSADMRRFRQLVLDSQDFQSSEYSATSEYALNNSTPSSDEMHKRKL